MKNVAFRHPDGARLALTSGHVTLVGPEWVELDEIFHREAMVQGCEVNKNWSQPANTPAADAGANKAFDEATVIREALELIKTREEPGDLTNAGLPNLKVVKNLVGFEVSKEQVYAIWREVSPSEAVQTTPEV